MYFILFLLATVCEPHGESVNPVPAEVNLDESKPEVRPYCGNDGCYNGGVCTPNSDETVISGSNHTGICKCMPGWTGSDCSTCNGRVELFADYANDRAPPIIHDGHRNYSSNAASKCSWLINSPAGSDALIKVNILNFETECGWDHLYIFDGTSAINSTTKAAYCGIINDTVEHTVYAEKGAVFLHFYSDMAYNMSGFEVSYELVDDFEPPSSTEITDENGNVWTRNQLDIGRGKSCLHVIGDSIFLWGGYQFRGIQLDNR